MKLHLCIGLAAALLSACGQQQRQPERPAKNTSVPTPAPVSAPPAVANSSPPAERPPSATANLPEPKGAIDPKSVEAGGQVVQHYGALIEQNRWDDAAKLWGSSDAAAKFDTILKSNRENHLEIGDAGRAEGAAGSIYLSVPVTLYGKDDQGKAFRAKRTIILRRVNDVPGSSEAQRRWHIEGVETGWPAGA
jgi:hypothetical protein